MKSSYTVTPPLAFFSPLPHLPCIHFAAWACLQRCKAGLCTACRCCWMNGRMGIPSQLLLWIFPWPLPPLPLLPQGHAGVNYKSRVTRWQEKHGHWIRTNIFACGPLLSLRLLRGIWRELQVGSSGLYRDLGWQTGQAAQALGHTIFWTNCWLWVHLSLPSDDQRQDQGRTDVGPS